MKTHPKFAGTATQGRVRSDGSLSFALFFQYCRSREAALGGQGVLQRRLRGPFARYSLSPGTFRNFQSFFLTPGGLRECSAADLYDFGGHLGRFEAGDTFHSYSGPTKASKRPPLEPQKRGFRWECLQQM